MKVRQLTYKELFDHRVYIKPKKYRLVWRDEDGKGNIIFTVNKHFNWLQRKCIKTLLGFEVEENE